MNPTFVWNGTRWLGIAVLGAVALHLVGCSSVPGGPGYDRTVQLSGAQPISPVEMETINLLELLDPQRQLPGLPAGTLANDQTLGKLYDLAFARFPYLGDTGASVRQRRNLVQNRILLAADRRCGRFLQHLKIQNSDTNFALGLATVISAAAAAVVPGVRDAKTLSAIGAVTSGSRAEYNNEYFSNLSVSIVTKAIEQHRAGVRAAVLEAQGRPYASYDVAAAVADAIRYDAACNVLSGLETANEAVQRMNEPGREAVKNALFNDRVSRAVAEGDWEQLKALAQMAGTVRQAYLPTYATAAAEAAGAPATSDAPAVTAVGLLTSTSAHVLDSLDAVQKLVLKKLEEARPEQIDTAQAGRPAVAREDLSKAITAHLTQAKATLHACLSAQAPVAWQLDMDLAAAQAALQALPLGNSNPKDAELLATRAQKSVDVQAKQLALSQWEAKRVHGTTRALQQLSSRVDTALQAAAMSTLAPAWNGTIKEAVTTATGSNSPMCVQGAT